MATKKRAAKPSAKEPTAKKGERKASAQSAAGASSKPRASKASDLMPLEEAELLLLASHPPAYDRLPDQSVPRMLAMSREVLAGARQAIDALESCTRITKADLVKLERESDLLTRCEALWAKSRDVRVDPKEVTEGESLKSDALAALDYWLEGHADVEERVSRIREGTGVADLADDLEKLATLLDEHKLKLKKADLVKAASSHMRVVAKSLVDALAGRKSDVHGKTLLSQRNRAFYGLMARMDAVCSAGRYAFRKEPRKAKLFASVATRKRMQASKGRPGAAKGDKPVPSESSEKKPT